MAPPHPSSHRQRGDTSAGLRGRRTLQGPPFSRHSDHEEGLRRLPGDSKTGAEGPAREAQGRRARCSTTGCTGAQSKSHRGQGHGLHPGHVSKSGSHRGQDTARVAQSHAGSKGQHRAAATQVYLEDKSAGTGSAVTALVTGLSGVGHTGRRGLVEAQDQRPVAPASGSARALSERDLLQT